MKSETKHKPLEFQLQDHPARCLDKVGGLPSLDFDKKRFVRRKREFFLTLDPEVEADRSIFTRWFPPGILLLNGHHAGQLAGFSPAFALPEADTLLTAIREARPEIERLQTERNQAAAEAAIMEAASEENMNPASCEMFDAQIEARKTAVRVADRKIGAYRRKLENDQQRILDLLAQENARQFREELSVVAAESEAINAEIMAAYARAQLLRPRLQRLSELTPVGKDFSPELGYLTTPFLDRTNMAALMNMRVAPGLQLTSNTLRFQLRQVEPVQQTEGGKK